MDYDEDSQPDRAELGRIVSEPDSETGEAVERLEVQAASENPELQGVWLSSRHDLATLNPAETLPDLTRQADWSADFEDRGLLSQISVADLTNTDLYVFRVSNGQLITERHGLKDSEVSSGFIGVNDEKGTFYYTIRVMGAREGRMNIHGYTSRWRSGEYGFQQWQAKGQMNPAYYEREADHLRPGEAVQLIAINRASGYMGTLITAVKQAGSSQNAHEISFPIEDLMMGPPNLKVWAERTSKVTQGLTRGDTPEQAIGHEGAGLADDTEITVYTEWFDRDGKALPEGLDEHGYTGRLAKVIAPNQLAGVGGASESGNSLSQFEIKTGRQTQVVRLPEKILGKQHLYVQVSGEPMVASTDQLIELLYDLTASEAGALDAYSYEGERELVFALGEHEIRATLGEGQQLQFDNDSLEHLAALDLTPEDYLMIRLYSNNDAGNILWEWAFSYLAGAPEEGEVNADEPTLELIVYATGVEDENVEMTWSVEGPGGSMASRSTASEIGIFTNTLHTSRTRDDIYFVTARVTSSEADE